jgi:hypothetical protein
VVACAVPTMDTQSRDIRSAIGSCSLGSVPELAQ